MIGWKWKKGARMNVWGIGRDGRRMEMGEEDAKRRRRRIVWLVKSKDGKGRGYWGWRNCESTEEQKVVGGPRAQ